MLRPKEETQSPCKGTPGLKKEAQVYAVREELRVPQCSRQKTLCSDPDSWVTQTPAFPVGHEPTHSEMKRSPLWMCPSSLQRGLGVPNGSNPQDAAGMRCGGWVSNLGRVEFQNRVAYGTLFFLSLVRDVTGCFLENRRPS